MSGPNRGKVFTVETDEGLELVEWDKATPLVRALIDECERQKSRADNYLRREAQLIDDGIAHAIERAKS